MLPKMLKSPFLSALKCAPSVAIAVKSLSYMPSCVGFLLVLLGNDVVLTTC